MADRYAGAFDLQLDSFGNRYQGSSTTACVKQQYSSTSGPCREDYDPSRIPMNVGTYNSTSGLPRGSTNSHQTLMPSSGNVVSRMQGSGLPEFEPLPIGKAALQRLNPPHPAHSNAPPRGLGPPPMSGFFEQSYASIENKDAWLDDLELSVSGLSLEPMKGSAIVLRLQNRTTEVATRYLPCVDFLVQCQQELRKGLAAATRKNMVQHMFRETMTSRQFYNTYVSNLPERFYRKNRRIMQSQNLDAAFKELQKLCADARSAESQGCEVIKNTFLGGMKDGESWGLRKWLSKHGGALQICNDCECVLHACQKLDRSLESTRKLGERLRPLADKALKKLKSDVPSSYQEQSSAHPYLPFFHRLESALRGMSNFDPEDDDVICIDDDDEVEAIKSQAATNMKPKKRKAQSGLKKPAVAPGPLIGGSDNDSIIEIFNTKPPAKKAKRSDIDDNDDADYMKELLKTFDEPNDGFDFFFASSPSGKKDSFDLAEGLERLAGLFDTNRHWGIRPNNLQLSTFWDESEKYASILRLFSNILRNPDSAFFLDSADDFASYSHIIKHPLSLRDIVSAIMEDTEDTDPIVGSTGLLPAGGLASWNMWRGNDLMQAIDLVFLNSLAYSRASQEGRSDNRSRTNKLRKLYWGGIKKLIDDHVGMDVEARRRYTPTRRGESSGFVINKDR